MPAEKKNSKNQEFDPERIRYVESYLEQNKGQFPLKNLKNALMAVGYSNDEIKKGLSNLKNSKVDGASVDNANPLQIKILFSTAFNFFKDNFLTLFLIQVVAMVPSIILQLRNAGRLEDLNQRLNSEVITPGETLNLLKSSLISLLDPINIIFIVAAVILMLFAIVALYRAIILNDSGEKTGVIDAYKSAVSYVPSYLGAMIIYTISLLVGFIFIIIPGLVLAIWFLFYGLAITAEDKGPVDSLKRSRELVKGFWWVVLGRVLLAAIVLMFVSMVASIAANIPFVGLFSETITQIVSGIFMAVYIFEIYKALRTIKEQ